MTGAELAAWARQHGYRTDADLAAELRLSPGQIFRYRHGINRIPGPVEVACERIALTQFLDELDLATISESLIKIIRMLITRREKSRVP